MRVLLVQPPLEDFYATRIRFYPLGLLYTARVFQVLGCRVGILDCLTPFRQRQRPLPEVFSYLKPFLGKTPHFFKGYYRFGRTVGETLAAIKELAPDRVGISAQFTAYYQSTAELAAAVKNDLGLPVFVGGNHASVFAEEIRRRTPEIDHVLTGPAETAVPAFLDGLEKAPSGRQSLDWKALRPAHELVEAGQYKIGRRNMVSLTASRGCPYHCEFCSVHTLFGRRIAYRPVADVIAEMCWNREHRDVEIFNFEDDNLSFDTGWFKRFLAAVLAEPLLAGVELTAMNGICYPTLDKTLLELMRRAGFRQINLAFVTRDARLRRRYRRPRPQADFEQIVAAAKALGFFVTVYVIIGLPDQAYAEIKGSIDYLLDLGVLVGPSVFYLPPGSRLYNGLTLSETIRENWNLYRSSAFALETHFLRRNDLVDLFLYTRQRNLENRLRPEP